MDVALPFSGRLYLTLRRVPCASARRAAAQSLLRSPRPARPVACRLEAQLGALSRPLPLPSSGSRISVLATLLTPAAAVRYARAKVGRGVPGAAGGGVGGGGADALGAEPLLSDAAPALPLTRLALSTDLVTADTTALEHADQTAPQCVLGAE